MRAFRLRHLLSTGMWPIPIVCLLGGVVLALVTVGVDNGEVVPVSLTGGPDTALTIFGTVAGAMITLTAVVTAIVLVVVQLAMQQFSPRIVRAILYDRPSQLAIGMFVGTFAHSMIAMVAVASTDPGAPVPGLAVVVAFVLVVASILALILYIDHIGQQLRSSALIESVSEDARDLLDKLFPDPGHNPDAHDEAVVIAPRSGVVFYLGEEQLVKLAAEADCALVLVPVIGDFVPAGAPLFRVVGDPHRLRRADVAAAVALGPERTLNDDLAYAFRMLVDIAQRSIAEYPATSVQAMDRLHDLLRQLAPRPFPSGEHRDEHGTLRLVVPILGWDGYVALAFDEIRENTVASIQVARRLRAAIEDLLTVAPAERRPALERQLRLLEDTQRARRAGEGLELDGWAAVDTQGIGSAIELRVSAPQLDSGDSAVSR